jgi:hypothetical protein
LRSQFFPFDALLNFGKVITYQRRSLNAALRTFSEFRYLQNSAKLYYSQILRMTKRILCVAEKNDAAKNIAAIMSNAQSRLRNGPAMYNKLYCFDANILGQQSSVVFTSVSGHLKAIDFPPAMKAWAQVPVSSCFTAPINSFVPPNMKTIEQQLM